MEAPNPNDYNPHDNHVAQILAIQSIVFVLAVSCVVMRLYVRIRIIKSTGVDDWTMGGAALCSIATWALYIYKGVHGIGRHNAWVLPEDQMKVNQAAFWQVIISSCLGMALLKISIGLNLLRLSPSRWYSWCLWAGIVFVAAYCFMGSMTFFLFCKPMAGFWDPTIPGVKCYSIQLFITFALMNTAFNIFSDVLFASLPVPIIWKLQMKRKVRLYLIGVLSLGYVAVAFGVTNGVFQIAYGNAVDSFYNDSIMFFAILQVNTGILAACVPSLKPLVSKVLKLSEYTNSNTHRYGTNSNRYGSRYGNQRSAHWNDPYDLDELTGHEDGSSSPNTAGHSASATYYRNGSEEKILPEQMPPTTHTKGIVMTTEINVQ